MTNVGIHEAKTHLSRLLRQVADGEEVIIMRGSEPIARIVPFERKPKRVWGFAKGEIWISDDFYDPMTAEDLSRWEGPIFPDEK